MYMIRIVSTYLPIATRSLSLLLLCTWLNGVAVAGVPEADQVLLDNGDRITGRFVSLQADSVSFATSAMGKIQIQLTSVSHLMVGGKEMALPSSTLASGQPTSAAPVEHAASSPGWELSIQGAPNKVTLGTQSQEQFGAGIGFHVSEGGAQDQTTLTAKGYHCRTYKEKSTSIQTDVAGAQLEQQHFLGSTQGSAVIGVAELFTNNSLGMAMQKSFGVGVLSPQLSWRKVFYDFGADVRYVNEHLDHSAAALDLAALRVKQQAHFNGGTVSWNEQVWVMPMLNDVHGLQAYASLGPSLSLKPWLRLGISEEESYLGNAPKPNHRNYMSSSLFLTMQFGSAGSTR
jgi:hypothetical protein